MKVIRTKSDDIVGGRFKFHFTAEVIERVMASMNRETLSIIFEPQVLLEDGDNKILMEILISYG